MPRHSSPRTVLMRNLQPGDIIELWDGVQYPAVRLKARVTNVHETRAFISGKRCYVVHFQPLWSGRPFSWRNTAGYSDSKILRLERGKDASPQKAEVSAVAA